VRNHHADQDRDNDVRLLRQWRRWHRDEIDQAFTGPHGAVVARIIGFLEHMTIRSAPSLVALVRSQNWQTIEYGNRLIVLHEISSAITALRERHRLPPFDDALDEKLSAFQLVRRDLLGNHASAENKPTSSAKQRNQSYD
jgi:hypothetical protein